MRLSIVVIGKDEAENLEALFASLKDITLSHEVIYVDSASEDESVMIALKHADLVCELAPSPQLCAAAGRHVGTMNAKGEWLLYLDGDMTLSAGFVNWMDADLDDADDDRIAGYVGHYTYYYRDGSESVNQQLNPASGRVRHFGGAVLLRREAVLEAGDWNPSVVSNEEIDLYARIQDAGRYVEAVDREMVRHLAVKLSKLEILLSMLYPRSRRYFGLGQVFRSQSEHGSLPAFMRHHPYMFIFWGLVLATLIEPWLWLLFIAFSIHIVFTKRLHYLLIYLTDLPRAILGMFTYKAYVPEVKCHTPSGIL